MSFARFLAKRAVQGVFVVWSVITVVFLLRYVTPGNPVNFVAPLNAGPQLKHEIAVQLGLNKPLYVQYGDYLWKLAHLNMGRSYVSHTSVSARVFGRLPVTVELAVAASLVAVVFSIPLGIVSATRRHQPADYAATTFSLLGISTPDFWLGLMLVLVFAVQFGLLPTSGVARYHGSRVLFPTALWYLLTAGTATPLVRWFQHIILPAITLGTYFMALITRLTRSGMLEELGKGYVQALRAKGLPSSRIRYRHVLKNTLIPVITVVGLQLGTLIGGAVVTESVFAWHGLGSLVVNAIQARDWMTIQGSLIVIGTGFVLVNIGVDAVYAYVNPQVSAE